MNKHKNNNLNPFDVIFSLTGEAHSRNHEGKRKLFKEMRYWKDMYLTLKDIDITKFEDAINNAHSEAEMREAVAKYQKVKYFREILS